MDKTVSQGVFEIDLDTNTGLPRTVKMLVMTGVKGEKAEKDSKKLEEQEHVVFSFNYALKEWGSVERFAIPKPAQAVLK